jgi:hypothetical protein
MSFECVHRLSTGRSPASWSRRDGRSTHDDGPRSLQRAGGFGERRTRRDDIVEHDHAASGDVSRPQTARHVLAPPVLVESALVTGLARRHEQRRRLETRSRRDQFDDAEPPTTKGRT